MRQTCQHFSGRQLSLEGLAALLHSGYGPLIRSTGSAEGEYAPHRTVPSAGALFPLEVYVAVFRVSDLAGGLYHFVPNEETLTPLRLDDVVEKAVVSRFVDAEKIRGSAAIVLVTSVFERSRFKYGLRGYRFALLEAGHLGQNIALAGAALEIGVMPIGGTWDDEIEKLLGVDGINEALVYAFAIDGEAEPTS
ncbi:MAG TPA: SagB/ThcOx family dehydrogenase [Solirubrobacteraceae bacterium]